MKVTPSAINRQSDVREFLLDSSRTLRELAREAPLIERAARVMSKCLKKKGKIISFGNGGSAADAQHLAAELSGRFEKDRPGLPAVALTTNTSTLTAIGNDYDYSQVFLRQLQGGFVKREDVVIAISTSGNSPSVVEAAREAKKAGATVIGWTGKDGGKLKAAVDICLCVPHTRTCRVQEGHLALLHVLCHLVEEDLFPGKRK